MNKASNLLQLGLKWQMYKKNIYFSSSIVAEVDNLWACSLGNDQINIIIVTFNITAAGLRSPTR